MWSKVYSDAGVGGDAKLRSTVPLYERLCSMYAVSTCLRMSAGWSVPIYPALRAAGAGDDGGGRGVTSGLCAAFGDALIRDHAFPLLLLTRVTLCNSL